MVITLEIQQFLRSTRGLSTGSKITLPGDAVFVCALGAVFGRRLAEVLGLRQRGSNYCDDAPFSVPCALVTPSSTLPSAGRREVPD